MCALKDKLLSNILKIIIIILIVSVQWVEASENNVFLNNGKIIVESEESRKIIDYSAKYLLTNIPKNIKIKKRNKSSF